jgi:hypothetical protein
LMVHWDHNLRISNHSGTDDSHKQAPGTSISSQKD